MGERKMTQCYKKSVKYILNSFVNKTSSIQQIFSIIYRYKVQIYSASTHKNRNIICIRLSIKCSQALVCLSSSLAFGAIAKDYYQNVFEKFILKLVGLD